MFRFGIKFGTTALLACLLALSGCDSQNKETDSMRFTKVKLEEVNRIAEKGVFLLSDSVLQSPEINIKKVFKAQDIEAEANRVLDRANIYGAKVDSLDTLKYKLFQVRVTLAEQSYQHLESALRKASVLINEWHKTTPEQLQKTSDASYPKLLHSIREATNRCCIYQINANASILENDTENFAQTIKFIYQFEKFVKQLAAKNTTLDKMLNKVANETRQFRAKVNHIKS